MASNRFKNCTCASGFYTSDYSLRHRDTYAENRSWVDTGCLVISYLESVPRSVSGGRADVKQTRVITVVMITVLPGTASTGSLEHKKGDPKVAAVDNLICVPFHLLTILPNLKFMRLLREAAGNSKVFITRVRTNAHHPS